MLTGLRIRAPELVCELRICSQLRMTKIRKRTAVLLPPSMRSGENDQREELRPIARNRRFLTAINIEAGPPDFTAREDSHPSLKIRFRAIDRLGFWIDTNAPPFVHTYTKIAQLQTPKGPRQERS